MKSIIPIDETWTVNSFRNSTENADEILSYNNLPNMSHPFDSLQTQQRKTYNFLGMLDEEKRKLLEDRTAQVQAVRLNLNDYNKAYAIAMMEPEDWLVYRDTGSVNGYLQVPEILVDERESVDEAIRARIMNSENDGNIDVIRELLAPQGDSDVAPSGSVTGIEETDWFWKPTGDVMFSVEGQSPMEIPCWPDNVKDTTSATWSQEMTTYQHYEPKNTYKSSGPRVVSCSFKIHRAMWDGNQDSGNTEALVAYMESACYPDYDTQASEPPRVLLLIGNSVRIKGILTSFDKTYQGPIGPDNCYDEVVISISITEESDNVLSTSAVRSGLAGWR